MSFLFRLAFQSGLLRSVFIQNVLMFSFYPLRATCPSYFILVFLGEFAKLWKATISFVLSVCPSVRPFTWIQLGSHWADFHEIWYFSIFRNPVQKIQVSLRTYKRNGYFTRIPTYTFDHISLISCYNEKYFRQNCRESQNTHIMFNKFFFRKSYCYEITWKNNIAD